MFNKPLMRPHLNAILILALFLGLSFCKNGEKEDDISIDEPVDSVGVAVAVAKTKKSAEQVFNSLPDRTEILKLVAENKLEYDTGILNEPNNVKKNYVKDAVNALLTGKEVEPKTTKAIGCTIKWKKPE